MMKNKLSIGLNILLIVGMLVSLLLTYWHFTPSVSKFCTFGTALDCDIVNKSPYANLDGISYLLTIDFNFPLPLIDISEINFLFDLLTSNAFIGFLTFLLIFLLRTKFRNKTLGGITPEKNLKWTRRLLLLGLIYGAYLLFIQSYILQTYCLFCLILDTILLTSFIISMNLKK
ncbi:vitamin K epoxide reductase family protein [Candidatus Pacearchaeota archaeon]|nr:vitamin K epoxide reductase family protein [Candidatus Pacearchaeota archaeon]